MDKYSDAGFNRSNRRAEIAGRKAEHCLRSFGVSLVLFASSVIARCYAASFAARAFQSICGILAHWHGPMWPRGEPQVILRSFGSAF